MSRIGIPSLGEAKDSPKPELRTTKVTSHAQCPGFDHARHETGSKPETRHRPTRQHLLRGVRSAIVYRGGVEVALRNDQSMLKSHGRSPMLTPSPDPKVKARASEINWQVCEHRA